jgi:UDP-N-acetylmuramoylalanine--D-glutamate ligase
MMVALKDLRMNLRNKNTLVVGLAKTGVACARFLASKGAQVTVTDMRKKFWGQYKN